MKILKCLQVPYSKNSELVVQIQSKVIHPLAFGDLVIANKMVHPFLKQVATVEDTQAELQSSAFYNGRTAVSVDILKAPMPMSLKLSIRLMKR